MAFTEDLDVFVDPDDFGEPFVFSGKRIYGIFDNDTYTVDNMNGVPIDIQRPTLLVKDSDVTTLAQGAKVTRVSDSQAYSVQLIAPDGTGMTLLGLKR